MNQRILYKIGKYIGGADILDWEYAGQDLILINLGKAVKLIESLSDEDFAALKNSIGKDVYQLRRSLFNRTFDNESQMTSQIADYWKRLFNPIDSLLRRIYGQDVQLDIGNQKDLVEKLNLTC